MKLQTFHSSPDNSTEELFAAIFRQYEQKMYMLVVRLTKSDQFAKDILQDVFMKLWEQRDHLHVIGNIEAWLYRLTENKVIDFLRKIAADTRLRQKVWQQVEQEANEAEQYLAVKEYNEIIRTAIDQLPPQRKLIYRMNKEEGMDYQQIADELHLSRHTVKNQLFTAMQSVRRFINRSTRLFSIFF